VIFLVAKGRSTDDRHVVRVHAYSGDARVNPRLQAPQTKGK
jgi:hypothetical protein